MLYVFLVIAALLFALQSLFSQKYRRTAGEGTEASTTFSMYVSTTVFVLTLIINGFHLEINWFSICLGLGILVINMASSYSSLKVLGVANLSVYSIFLMLGGMLLPFVFGVLFYDEPLSVQKILCVLLIVISLLLTVEKGKKKGKAAIFYAAVFVLNGLDGVIATIHQSSEHAVDSVSYLATCSLFTALACAAYQLVRYRKITVIKWKAAGCIGAYAICNGIGYLLVLIALRQLPASVQYPIVTGGVMVFATVISILRRERPTNATILSAVIALAATVLMMF